MTEVVRKLGRYELLRRIAMGGMGEIYLARMRGTGGFEKRVIIKTILPHLAEQDEFVTKFLDEGRIVVDLVHGNIVPVFDMNEEDGEIFLAMEYIPGRDLREVLKRAQLDQVEIPVALSLYIVAELCKGLDYAHRKVDPDGELLEIVHRDISPSNVMLSGTGEVKIIDFGIARASTKLSTSIDGRIQGKFCYMSPEQASGKEVDARSDIFSTGVVLYELLTGMRPFEGYTDLESLELVRAAAYDPAGTLNPKVPQVVDEIIDRALARDRDARYASIDRMQVDLLQHLYSVEGAPTPSEVGAFLDALFPEGVEREELRPPSSRSTSGRRKPSPGQAMSLEDAMALELERMAAGSEDEVSDSNPHISSSRTPAPSKSAETATLVPASVDPRVPERVSQSTAPEAFLDTVEDLAGAAAEARAVAQRPSSGRTPSLPTRLDVDASADGGVDQLAEAAGRTSSADLKDSPERAPGDAAPSAPMSVDIARILGLRRAIAAVGVAVAVAVGAALLGMAVWEDKRQGTIEIRTTPAGASIYIDGALEPDQVTPHTLTLPVGLYKVRLELEGFASSGDLNLKVRRTKRDEVVPFPKSPLKLRRLPSTRKVLVYTKPEGATIADGKDVLGVTPLPVLVREGKPRTLRISKDGCASTIQEVDFASEMKSVRFPLECETSARRRQKSPGAQRAPTPRFASRTVGVTFSTTPPDALVTLDGDPIERGRTLQLDAKKTYIMRVTRDGYAPFSPSRKTGAELAKIAHNVKLSKLEMGCLKITMSRSDSWGYLTIDGDPVPSKTKMVRGLENYEIAAGRHIIRHRNDEAGFDVTRVVDVSAGEPCTQSTLTLE